MNKTILTVVPACMLIASVALAGGVDASGPRSYSLLKKYRFSEADLRRLERVHVTGNTALWGVQPVKLDTDTDTDDKGDSTSEGKDQVVQQSHQSAASESVLEWSDADGKVWSLWIEDAPSRSGLIRSAPPRQDSRLPDQGAPQGVGEDFGLMGTPNPEPASLGMMAFGLICICPRRGKHLGGEA